MENKSIYRLDIDGLRAIAVIAVIINHFNKEILPNGYLGVDMFFVISGYVITLSLDKKKSNNLLDFLISFYERRIRRLLPVLLVFVLSICFFISLFNGYPIQSLKTGIYSLIGLSNYYLIRYSTDYFANPTDLNPFAHTWSLGVEQQFYILFPIIIWFTGFNRELKNSKRNLFYVLLSFSIFSFISFVYFYQVNQPLAYFAMPTRFWEMSSGALLFLALKKNFSYLEILKKIYPITILLLIIGTFLLPLSAAVPATVLIILLTNILILCLKESSLVFKIITFKPFLYIGSISYSLYLWHWAVLSLSRWTIGIHWWSIPFQVLIIFFLASTSYKFVEAPFRKKSFFKEKWKIIMFGTGIITTSVIFLFFATINNLNRIVYIHRLFNLKSINEENKNLIECHGFENLKRIKDPFNYCLKHRRMNENDKRFYLLGDSHAAQFFYMVKNVLSTTKYQLAFINTDHLKDFPYIFFNELISVNQPKTITEIIKNIRSDDVIAISFHRGLLNRIRDEHVTKYSYLNKNKKYQYAKANFSKFIAQIQEKDIKVILIKDTPLLNATPISTCILQEKFLKWNSCEVTKKQDDLTRSEQEKLFKFIQNNFKNIYIWDPRVGMINKDSNFSYDSIEGIPIMKDWHHITTTFSIQLSAEFKDLLMKEEILLFEEK